MKKFIFTLLLVTVSSSSFACENGCETSAGSISGIAVSATATAGSYATVTGPDQSASSFSGSHADSTATVSVTGNISPAGGSASITSGTVGHASTWGGGSTTGVGAGAGAGGFANTSALAGGAGHASVNGPACDGVGNATLISVSGHDVTVEGGNYVRDGESGEYGIGAGVTTVNTASVSIAPVEGGVVVEADVTGYSTIVTETIDVGGVEYPTDGSTDAYGIAGQGGYADINYMSVSGDNYSGGEGEGGSHCNNGFGNGSDCAPPGHYHSYGHHNGQDD